MEKAFSLLNNKLISARSTEYRRNLDEQIVCPTCYEPVFKKKLWVSSKYSETHFFSHYVGDQDSCPDRTFGEGNLENRRDSIAQHQKLEIFNQYFRENIKESVRKIVGIQAFKKLDSALEYAERICVQDINNKELDKLELSLIKSLDKPITSTIDENLEELEDALLPIYYHFKSNYGQKNLTYLTCCALLHVFYKENIHLETILVKKSLKAKTELHSNLLVSAVLLLANSEYISWTGSKKPILNFIDKVSENFSIKDSVIKKKNLIKNGADESNFDYPFCPSCNRNWWLKSGGHYECYYCQTNFNTGHANEKSASNKSLKVNPKYLNETVSKKSWHFCDACRKSYFSVLVTDCPHIENSNYKDEKAEFNRAIKNFQRCPKCSANFLGVSLNECPYCNDLSLKRNRTCDGCGKGQINSALLPSSAGSNWRKCNFCNLHLFYK